HPMNSAPLPCRTEHAGDRVAQAIVSVGNHQLDALETTLDQALQKSRPERFGFGRAETQADDLAPAFGCDRHGDYRSDRDDAAAVADLEVGRVKPEIGPLAVDRPVEESADPFINVLAELGDLALRDAGQPHRLDQFVDPPGRDAADPSLLDYRDQRLLGGLARLKEGREVRTLAQLGDAQAQRAEPGVEAAVAIAIAVIEPLGAALVPAGADQPFDIGFHQDLQHRLRYGSQEIAVTALLQQLDQRHSLIGHRVLGGLGWVSQRHLSRPSR